MASSSSFSNVKPWLCLTFLFVLHTSLLLPICNCQPQNIETFFPPETPPPAPAPPPTPSISPSPPVVPPPETTRSPSSSSSSSSSNSKVGRAVAITAASTVVVSALAFFFIRWCLKKRRSEERRVSSASEPVVSPPANAFERIEGNVKGLIVDENGLDVIYWRKLEGKNGSKNKGLQREEVRTIAKEQDQEQEVKVVTEEEDDGDEGDGGFGGNYRRKKSEPVQEIPLLRGKSSASEKSLISEDEHGSSRSWMRTLSRKTAPSPPNPPVTAAAAAVSPPLPLPPAAYYYSSVSKAKNVEPPPQPPHAAASSSVVSPPLPPPPAAYYYSSVSKAKNVELPPHAAASSSVVSPPLPPPPSAYFSAVNKTKSTEPPPPPPLIPDKKAPAPPPPPPPAKKGPAPPPPPPPAKKGPAPPPAPPMAGNLKSSSKPPPSPAEMSGEDTDKVKLKPLHWDKVTTNVDHSMVWDKLDRGSFRVDQDFLEALFGYVATSKRSPRGGNDSSSPSKEASAQSSTIFILDPKKSQNFAIVLRSLAVSRREIVDALEEGQGLSSDIVEKIVRVAPNQEEQSNILQYNGDPARLAVAESFLYDILNAVPSAFKRLNAMHFRFNYDSEVLEIKESLNILELACKELRNRGLLVKLLEAVLKAGNHMNAGTSRGNAEAFNLTSLKKLKDVKTTDGKSTLLHFVVEGVVRSEGRRCVLNRDWSLSRNGSRKMNGKGESENFDEQREMEYLMLGLPFVGGISTEFSNLKKSAIIDYSSLLASISSLSTRIAGIKQLVSQCGNAKGGNFEREMDLFLRNAEEELGLVRDEDKRVMQIVKKTNEYYQGGASKNKAENVLEIFVIVKDFLEMVDQACIDISRNMNQKRKKTTKSNSG